MVIREAIIEDISQIQIVRHGVKENVLSNPALVSDEDCLQFLTIRGKGWVCIMDDMIVGFAIADLQGNNIWALFIRPEYENLGTGKKMHDLMLNWYFSKTTETVWLGTAPGTRAEKFYIMAGWKTTGLSKNGEIHFEMTNYNWINKKVSV